MMWLKNTFSADLRALAAFRIGLALVVLGDLYGRLPDLREFYTDAGIIPRDLALKHMLGDWLPSLHYSGGSMGKDG